MTQNTIYSSVVAGENKGTTYNLKEAGNLTYGHETEISISMGDRVSKILNKTTSTLLEPLMVHILWYVRGWQRW